MNKHGFRHVRKINDGRPKPYFGRIDFAGEQFQVGGFAAAIEAHQAAVDLRLALSGTVTANNNPDDKPKRT